MKKHLRILFTMLLALVGMGSWAQTPIEVVGDLRNDKVYQIKCNRDYLGVTSAGYMNGVANAVRYRTPGDDNKFAVLKGNDGYYLYATERGKFVPTTGKSTTATGIPAQDAPTSAFDIQGASKAGRFLIISQETNCWMMFGGAYQFLASDNWKQEDDGDVWSIYEIGDLDPEVKAAAVEKIEAKEGQPFPADAVIEVAKLTLTAEYNESKTMATITIDGLTGNGVIGAVYFGEDFDAEDPNDMFAPNETSTVLIAPNSYPASLVVTIREYDEEMNVLAEGHIILDFPRDTSLFDEDKLYTIRTAGGRYLSAADIVDGELATVEEAAEAGKFKITYFAGDYFIYNKSLNKYLSANANADAPYVDEQDGGFDIFLSRESGDGIENAWLITSNETGNWMQVNNMSYVFMNSSEYQVLDANNQWFIEETEDEPIAVAELTLTAAFNETNTIATVTVEGLTGNGTAVVYYFDDDFEEPAGGLGDGETTFEVAPIFAPATIKVTVRELDDDMNILAEGEITLDFPELPAEPIYTAVGQTYSDKDWNSDYQTAHLVDGELAVEAYEDYVIIKAFDGVEGYDLKVSFDEDENATAITVLHNGEETDATAGWAYSGADNWYVYTDGVSYAGSDSDSKSGYVLLSAYVGSDYVYYYVAWGEDEEEDAPLYTVNGAVTPQFIELLGDDSDFPTVSDVEVSVYDQYVYIKAWAGVEGYDLKLYTNEDRTAATKIVPVVNNVEGEPITWYGEIPTGLESQETVDVIVSFKEDEADDDWFISEMSLSEEAGFITMLFQSGFSGYYLSWPANNEQPGDEVLLTLNGTVQEMPNAYISGLLGLDEMAEEGIGVVSMDYAGNKATVDVYADYFIIKDFMGSSQDLKCWYQVDDSDEDDIQTLIYQYQIVGQEIEEIPGNVSGSYIVVNMEGYDLQMGMCDLNPMGGWLTIIASKLSDLKNYYHYSLEFSPVQEVAQPTIDPAEGDVESLEVFTLTFDQDVTIDDSEDAEWYMPILVDANYNAWFGEVAMGENANQVVITISDKVERGGTYALFVNAALFGLGDAQWVYNYTINGGVEPEPELEDLDPTTLEINPADGSTLVSIDNLKSFTITFNTPVMDADLLDGITCPVLKDANGNVVATAWSGLNKNYSDSWMVESVDIEFEFEDNASEQAKAPKRASLPNGQYTLVVPIKVTNDWMTWAGTTLVYNYTLADPTGIDGVKATEGETIFNLSGQKVNKAQKGLYIINGKKSVVK